MQTWLSATEKSNNAVQIFQLMECFYDFIKFLPEPVDVIILDINGGKHSSTSWHSKDKAVDFCFDGLAFEYIKHSEILYAAFRAGFRGVGIYFGTNKKSFHLDMGDRTAVWTARKYSGKWKYKYFNREGFKK